MIFELEKIRADNLLKDIEVYLSPYIYFFNIFTSVSSFYPLFWKFIVHRLTFNMNGHSQVLLWD